VRGTGSESHLVVGFDVGDIELWILFLESQLFRSL
jgi:hypothetical protein